ncbi:MAG: hypothetical protein MHPSP_004912, partial [Paramarteilia canceri]
YKIDLLTKEELGNITILIKILSPLNFGTKAITADNINLSEADSKICFMLDNLDKIEEPFAKKNAGKVNR